MEVRNYAFGLLDITGELLPYWSWRCDVANYPNPAEEEVAETPSVKNLGDIKLIVQSGHVVNKDLVSKNFSLQDTSISSETTKINERSKKALTHRVK